MLNVDPHHCLTVNFTKAIMPNLPFSALILALQVQTITWMIFLSLTEIFLPSSLLVLYSTQEWGKSVQTTGGIWPRFFIMYLCVFFIYA